MSMSKFGVLADYMHLPLSSNIKKDKFWSFWSKKRPRNRPQLPILCLDWRYLLQFSIDIDYNLAYLVRFEGPKATFLGSGHPKTIEKAFFYKIIPSQPCRMTIKDSEVTLLKAPKILQIQIGVKNWVFTIKLGSFWLQSLWFEAKI